MHSFVARSLSRRRAFTALTKDKLTGKAWRRVAPRVYAASELAEDPYITFAAALKRAPTGSVLSGASAAWLSGFDGMLPVPVHITTPPGAKTTHLFGTVVHRCRLATSDITTVRSLPTTTLLRTVVDIARTLPFTDSVPLLDAALHRRAVSQAELCAWAATHSRFPGVARLRKAITLTDAAAESPMETRLRLLLALSRLPRPDVQTRLHDGTGRFVARADLYYPGHRLVIEYDGAGHRERLAEDDRRQNRLLVAGYRLLRFTAIDVLGSPERVVALVRDELRR